MAIAVKVRATHSIVALKLLFKCVSTVFHISQDGASNYGY